MPSSAPTPATGSHRWLNVLAVLHLLAALLAAALGSAAFLLMPQPLRILRGAPALDGFGSAPPAWLAILLLFLAALLILLGWTVAVCLVIAADCLARRRRRMLCLVMELNTVVLFPVGTLLAVATFLTLRRPSVRALFQASPPPLPPVRT